MEQGYGGPVERSRTLSTSGPVPNGDGEGMKDTDVQMQPAPQNEPEGSKVVQPSQESPRRCEGAVRTSSPASAARSESGSASASDSEHARGEATSTLTGRKSRRHSAPQPWPVEPPVTRSTLSELDVSKIIHNPKLRHDINFDPELHFRPNLDGEKGRKKQERANQFWKTLKEELTEFLMDRPSFDRKHGERNDWTLPALLKAVKEIIQTLVPQRDRQFLDEGLNVELLMQQFNKGIADLEKLASWLSRVLKSHCAPMRDDWVDTMYAQLSNGNRNGDLDELVTGMRSLLSVLEAMKLDVANHQIRCLRPVLIEDTTHFEQKFFLRKIQSRKVDVTGARLWYSDAERTCDVPPGTSQTFGDMGVFFDGLTRLLLPSTQEKRVPSTFLFDEERIMKLRSDVLDAINLDVCMRMYEELEGFGSLNYKIFGARRAMDEFDRCATPENDFNFNTPPASSRPSSLVFSSAGSASSSPRSSVVVPSYVAPENTEARTKARNLYTTLVALLQSAKPTSRPHARWEEMAPSMAIEIFRSTSAPHDILPAFEEKVVNTITTASSDLYRDVESKFQRRLMAELSGRVRELKALSGVSLFAVATGARIQNNSGVLQTSRDTEAPSRDGLEEGGVEDMATRLAHLGILHWRVWSPLVYAGDQDEMVLDDTPNQI
ncbi:Protein SOSEKI 1 [Purpureocillium takamizusanense]|nr:Protein SOSEKI 1 [Purpureocillium takamizusanense]UNI20019.1 Protein SOSEKI 1 [Purpureocillium takamizusanense]